MQLVDTCVHNKTAVCVIWTPCHLQMSELCKNYRRAQELLLLSLLSDYYCQNPRFWAQNEHSHVI